MDKEIELIKNLAKCLEYMTRIEMATTDDEIAELDHYMILSDEFILEARKVCGKYYAERRKATTAPPVPGNQRG